MAICLSRDLQLRRESQDLHIPSRVNWDDATRKDRPRGRTDHQRKVRRLQRRTWRNDRELKKIVANLSPEEEVVDASNLILGRRHMENRPSTESWYTSEFPRNTKARPTTRCPMQTHQNLEFLSSPLPN